MKILIADDDAVTRHTLKHLLHDWGYEVIAVEDGLQAWEAFQDTDPPAVAIIDWIMPEMTGLQVIKKVRDILKFQPHMILLTTKGNKEDIMKGLASGANDYVTKPFDDQELRTRVSIAFEIVKIKQELKLQVAKLEFMMDQVQQLRKFIPVCPSCKKIREDEQFWHEIRKNLSQLTSTQVSDAFCPDCSAKRND